MYSASIAMTASKPPTLRLTRREDEVARLVAEGMTNREIAERLFISERTAEHHVEQVRNKLGFRSRTQIAGWVAQGAQLSVKAPGPSPPGALTVTRVRASLPLRKWLTAGAAAALIAATGTALIARQLEGTGVAGPAISTIAGSSKLPEGGRRVEGYSGDYGQAKFAQLFGPTAVAVAKTGDIYIADGANGVIRKIDPAGIITTVAGGGGQAPAQGALASSVDIGFATAVAVKADGEVIFANLTSLFLRRPDSSLQLLGDFGEPFGIAAADDGSVYVSDQAMNVVWRLDRDGHREIFAGDGHSGYKGDLGSALGAELDEPAGLALDSRRGVLYVADSANDCVRAVDLRTRIITTVAGTGQPGYTGDGRPATKARLDLPVGVAIGPHDALYIADTGNNSVRRVLDGGIATVAGTGQAGFAGDGGPAASATFDGPTGLAYEAGLGLLVADTFNDRIRVIGLR
jgi:DNA-binding CsgD family transcriptional regulator/DNA-binding beta-propeller fold protein YncE